MGNNWNAVKQWQRMIRRINIMSGEAAVTYFLTDSSTVHYVLWPHLSPSFFTLHWIVRYWKTIETRQVMLGYRLGYVRIGYSPHENWWFWTVVGASVNCNEYFNDLKILSFENDKFLCFHRWMIDVSTNTFFDYCYMLFLLYTHKWDSFNKQR